MGTYEEVFIIIVEYKKVLGYYNKLPSNGKKYGFVKVIGEFNNNELLTNIDFKQTYPSEGDIIWLNPNIWSENQIIICYAEECSNMYDKIDKKKYSLYSVIENKNILIPTEIIDINVHSTQSNLRNIFDCGFIIKHSPNKDICLRMKDNRLLHIKQRYDFVDDKLFVKKSLLNQRLECYSIDQNTIVEIEECGIRRSFIIDIQSLVLEDLLDCALDSEIVKYVFKDLCDFLKDKELAEAKNKILKQVSLCQEQLFYERYIRAQVVISDLLKFEEMIKSDLQNLASTYPFEKYVDIVAEKKKDSALLLLNKESDSIYARIRGLKNEEKAVEQSISKLVGQLKKLENDNNKLKLENKQLQEESTAIITDYKKAIEDISTVYKDSLINSLLMQPFLNQWNNKESEIESISDSSVIISKVFENIEGSDIKKFSKLVGKNLSGLLGFKKDDAENIAKLILAARQLDIVVILPSNEAREVVLSYNAVKYNNTPIYVKVDSTSSLNMLRQRILSVDEDEEILIEDVSILQLEDLINNGLKYVARNIYISTDFNNRLLLLPETIWNYCIPIDLRNFERIISFSIENLNRAVTAIDFKDITYAPSPKIEDYFYDIELKRKIISYKLKKNIHKLMSILNYMGIDEEDGFNILKTCCLDIMIQTT